MDKGFEALREHGDKYSKNLNKVFESYGTETLEAKVPIIEQPTYEKMKECSEDQQYYATLALKSEAGIKAVRGSRPKTKNVDLSVDEIKVQTMLSMGKVRERSPVDRAELDDELDAYHRETAKRRALKLISDEAMSIDLKPEVAVKTEAEDPLFSQKGSNQRYRDSVPINNRSNLYSFNEKENSSTYTKKIPKKEPEEIDEEILNIEMDHYHQEAKRFRERKEEMLRICPDTDINEYDEDF